MDHVCLPAPPDELLAVVRDEISASSFCAHTPSSGIADFLKTYHTVSHTGHVGQNQHSIPSNTR